LSVVPGVHGMKNQRLRETIPDRLSPLKRVDKLVYRRDLVETMTRGPLQHIPLAAAYLCQDCDAVGNCAMHCPACASRVLMSLAVVLDREECEPKANWQQLSPLAA